MLFIEITKIELTGSHIGNNYTIHKECQNRIIRQPYWKYLLIETAKLELSSGHIGILLFIEIAKLELISGHIGIMLSIEMEN